jgi:hypothetical protein
MFDKLFVRVRSWLHNDPASLPADGGVINGKPAHTPPPLPPDAWMESESGMVITESGIIVIDPKAAEAAGLVGPAPGRRASAPPLPADRAWALPNLPVKSTGSPPPPSPPQAAAAASKKPTMTPGDLDWDEVLKRAREQINVVTPPPTGRTPAGSK